MASRRMRPCSIRRRRERSRSGWISSSPTESGQNARGRALRRTKRGRNVVRRTTRELAIEGTAPRETRAPLLFASLAEVEVGLSELAVRAAPQLVAVASEPAVEALGE